MCLLSKKEKNATHSVEALVCPKEMKTKLEKAASRIKLSHKISFSIQHKKIFLTATALCSKTKKARKNKTTRSIIKINLQVSKKRATPTIFFYINL